ncbi:ORM1-like protein 1 [Lingula anatina]|uniref:ORM1-like protein 1 n=1 Tax=Lingula anatina TaxID=7574 RepID=A0A1S3IE03_LINAN|nr:ORM1-like protein 1 [Lingula anatina]|eukprot:XP_013382408.1 ORM1-like protein 1 [Lingula anatina]
MNVGTATSEQNPTHSYLNSKGMWLTYILLISVLHFLLLSFPFFTVAWVWTCTNVIHNIIMFFTLHITKGTPWETSDQGKERFMTQWEQIDYGQHFTATKKFFTLVPIVLFFLASFYTKYEATHFVINASVLALNIIPKLPQLYGVRLFDINKY